MAEAAFHPGSAVGRKIGHDADLHRGGGRPSRSPSSRSSPIGSLRLKRTETGRLRGGPGHHRERAGRIVSTAPQSGHFAKAGVEAGPGALGATRRSGRRARGAGARPCSSPSRASKPANGWTPTGVTIGKGFAGVLQAPPLPQPGCDPRQLPVPPRGPAPSARTRLPAGCSGQEDGRALGNVPPHRPDLEVVPRRPTARGLLLVKGAIPGPKGGNVLVRPSVKGGNGLVKLDVAGGAPIEVAERAFAAPWNETLVHQAVTAFFAECAGGRQAQKSRADRPRGRAQAVAPEGYRAGPGRHDPEPIWRGGGALTFAAPAAQLRPEAQPQDVSRGPALHRVRAGAARAPHGGRVLHVDAPKTRTLLAKLEDLGVDNGTHRHQGRGRESRPCVAQPPPGGTVPAHRIDPVILIAFSRVLMTEPALRQIEERLA